MKKAKQQALPKYTSAKGQCMVVTIEAVYRILAEGNEAQDTLEQLQQYGAARVIGRRVIAEDFDTAANILDARARILDKEIVS